MKRTHTCGELDSGSIGKSALLQGWVENVRDHGGVMFINVRDRYGITQLVVRPDNKEAFSAAETLRRESVVQAAGKVVEREQKNPNMPTGDIEVVVDRLDVLSLAEPLPVEYKDMEKITEDSRLKYRYLDLRRPEMQKNLLTRNQIYHIAHEHFNKEGFVEIETPGLAKSTPEGARDYLVPSRVHPGNFFALPQSPQQYKQLLMVSGFDRYMQIVKCFRDEDLRADRQPEFTQIDIECSFLDPEDFFGIIEGFMVRLFKEVKGQDIKVPFPRMPYYEAMERFGIDRPDTRFGLELMKFNDIFGNSGFKVFKDTLENGGSIYGIAVEKEFSRNETAKLEEHVKIYNAKGLVSLKMNDGLEGPVSKFLSDDEKKALIDKAGLRQGMTLFMVADHKHHVCQTALGELRLKLGRELGMIEEERNDLLWVVDFPLLEYDEDEGRHVAVHHPFTSPKKEWMENFDRDPHNALADAYDLVWNGVEIAGGSKRIHRRDIQQRVFRLLGISDEEADEKFSMLLEAFKYGAPPHLGIAFGLDRLAALFTGNDSIREVIAFPKNKACVALMEGAPSEVDDKQYAELSIKKDVKK
ncbi:aspartate--tRNA ligase [Candidatus Woesearchaeota archaeon]|nr:aspartate--tRNA ligase [Candidatus Woesearchaeota archaeon]